MSNGPTKKYSIGGIEAVIWTNKAKFGNQEKEFQTVTLTKNYKDKENNWKTTNNLKTEDLPKAALLINKAYEEIMLKRTSTTA